ncbi:hypothetical protein Pmani_022210 [Petrolisthes manimaculis]|uniref:Uncharacterized protein n=1 Tax=Petrolisthes manimaculis TaxID=1843537 RepID=A0AAE1PEB3_9EUCA|nr:hypothetical protein Pmani_022210 [Petrolisthes manimaculis]
MLLSQPLHHQHILFHQTNPEYPGAIPDPVTDTSWISSSLNSVLTTRSFHRADCDIVHSLVSSKVRSQPKRIHRSKQKRQPRINTARTVMPDLCERFACSIEEALTDCPTSGIAELEPALSAKRTALLDYKREPSKKTLAAFRNAWKDTQRIARRCANDYWLNLCQNIQLSADCGNICGMYDGMKKAQASLRLRP